MAHPCGWMLALTFLAAPPAPDDPAGREQAAAIAAREEREATTIRRCHAAEVALPRPSARRNDLAAGDKARSVVLVGEKQVLLFLEPRPIAPGGGPLNPLERGQPGPAGSREMALAGENFDLLVFPPAHREANDVQVYLHETLAEQVREVEASRPLADAERARLTLAGRGDIEHFYRRVAAARAGFEVARFRFDAGVAAAGRLESLAAEYNDGPFGPGSLFRKTLRSIRPDGR